MKKIEQISLNGIVFNVEEDAYTKLKQYITLLTNYYSDKESGKEIVDDIQTRFAELLLEKKQFVEQAITITHVEEVIAILGYPESFENESHESTRQTNTIFEQKTKRLYRDSENARIAGVCSGLAHYLGGDAWMYRVVFVILGVFSFGIFAYIILWFVIPKAETTTQRYEMKGEGLTIDSIEHKIKTEITDAGNRVKDFVGNNSDKFKNTAQKTTRTVKSVLVSIGKFAGLAILFFTFFSIAAITISWFYPGSSIFVAHQNSIHAFCISEMFTLFGLNKVVSILCFVWCLLPLTGFFILGCSLVLRKIGKKYSFCF